MPKRAENKEAEPKEQTLAEKLKQAEERAREAGKPVAVTVKTQDSEIGVIKYQVVVVPTQRGTIMRLAVVLDDVRWETFVPRRNADVAVTNAMAILRELDNNVLAEAEKELVEALRREERRPSRQYEEI